MEPSTMDSEHILIEKIRKLPAHSIDGIVQFIDMINQIDAADNFATQDDDLHKKLASLRGRGKGEQLVTHLLRSRSRENHGCK